MYSCGAAHTRELDEEAEYVARHKYCSQPPFLDQAVRICIDTDNDVAKGHIDGRCEERRCNE
jgi:hypothetical protein